MLALALTQHALMIAPSHSHRKDLCEAVLRHYESNELRQIRNTVEESKQEVVNIWSTYRRGTRVVRRLKTTRVIAAQVTKILDSKLTLEPY